MKRLNLQDRGNNGGYLISNIISSINSEEGSIKNTNNKRINRERRLCRDAILKTA